MRLTWAYVMYGIFNTNCYYLKKKSNLPCFNTDQKPFAYCQITPALVMADSP